MQVENEAPVKEIHKQVIREIGFKNALGLLELARDLRSGAIPRTEFDMTVLHPGIYSNCGTACCILGHFRIRMKVKNILAEEWGNSPGLTELFAMYHPSDPKLAADAIERYVYENSEDSWNRIKNAEQKRNKSLLNA